jgi:hypothetical protein
MAGSIKEGEVDLKNKTSESIYNQESRIFFKKSLYDCYSAYVLFLGATIGVEPVFVNRTKPGKLNAESCKPTSVPWDGRLPYTVPPTRRCKRREGALVWLFWTA